MRKRGKFYITTPIYYVNARPHLGHAYTTIVFDALARYHRMLGDDTFLLTGTDEHGVNVERSATAAGQTAQQWADAVAGEFRATFDRLGITYDDFIRTTEPRHKRGAQELWRALEKAGHIYKGTYSGQYCIYDNLYVDATGPGAPCPECGRPTETVCEENYYFKLSAFEKKLLRHYEAHPEFIRPETRHNEVISFVRAGLRDLSISRSTFQWGVPVPDDPKHVMYVWLDALSNYITAIGYGSDARKFKRYWPAEVHMIGKEIVRFHCVFWPAFLMAAALPLPRSLFAHGWLLFEESKMSKSRGNVVRAESIVDVLGNDALRYFLLREVVFGQDGTFSFDALVGRYNSDLANDLGNLSSRTLTMIARYFEGVVPAADKPGPAEKAVARHAANVIKGFHSHFEAFEFSRALESAWLLVGAVNKYIVEAAPWALAEKPDRAGRTRLAAVLYTSAEALRVVTALAHPVLPESTARIWKQLGLGDIAKVRLDKLAWGQLKAKTKLGKVEGVFPRADKSAIERMQKMEEQRTSGAPPKPVDAPQAAKPAASPPPSSSDGKIGIEDFAKVEMRVGQVKVAERVPNTDKLLRLEVDIGTEVRQVVAGIAEAYTPETLIGRKVVLVVNLAPRKLRGVESNGMILAASVGDKGSPVLAGFLEDVPVGARLK